MKKAKYLNLKTLFETLSPLFVDTKPTSITIGISKRFFLFQFIRLLTRRIEDDPYLNFISVLKNYKVLGRFLHGTIREFHRDRNKSYFKHFFVNQEIYREIKKDLEWVYQKNKELKVTITKRGVIIYDNYKKNSFNILLMTIHSGTVIPEDVAKKQTLSKRKKRIIEDTDIHKIYSGLVLEKNGIWIDTKLSRFACDFNRSYQQAIYSDKSEKWIKKLWKEPLTQTERKRLMEEYREFYFTLSRLIETYRFNIIFDGHSMKNAPNRPEVSFGVKFVPIFYLPVVKSMRRKFKRLGYQEVAINKPFSGGWILEWLHQRFPDIFIFSMEINKKIYMRKDRPHSLKRKLKKLYQDMVQIVDIEEEREELE